MSLPPISRYVVQSTRFSASDVTGMVETAMFGALQGMSLKAGDRIVIEVEPWFAIGERGIQVVAEVILGGGEPG